MAGTVENLARKARRRLLASYLARELAWRALVVLVAMAICRLLGWTWAIPLAASVILLLHLLVRWRGPTLLSAAIEVDRQLALKELISTALVSHDEEEEMARATAQRAEEVAAGIDPAVLDPGGYGLRYWIAALILLGLLPLVPQASEEPFVAQSPQHIARSAQQQATPQENELMAAMRNISRRRPTAPPGSASSDFASDMFAGEDVVGQPSEASGTRSDAEPRMAGAGLATGGTHQPAAGQPDFNITARGDVAGTDGPGTGAGQASSEAGESIGSGVVASKVTESEDQQTTGTALPGTHAQPDLRAIAPEYRAIIRAYYDR